MTAPDPLVPAECTMSGNDWYPLHFDRMRKSKWWRRASDLARARNVMLWGEAYKQVPGGSMPDDDDDLAEAAGFGMDVEAFAAVKDEIMAPWVLCSDGRWYHPTVCEVVLETWEKASEKKKQAARKKAAQRAKTGGQAPKTQRVPSEKADVPSKKADVPRDMAEKQGDIHTHNREDITERTKPPLSPNGGKQADLGLEVDEPPTGRRKPKRPLPDGFPDDRARTEQQLKAREAGADIDVGYIAERFRNWAMGKDARFADWPATWRNWMAKEIRDAAKPAPRPAGAQADPWRPRVREFSTNIYWNDLEWGPKPGRPGCNAPAEVQREFGIEPAPPQSIRGVA